MPTSPHLLTWGGRKQTQRDDELSRSPRPQGPGQGSSQGAKLARQMALYTFCQDMALQVCWAFLYESLVSP